MINPVNIKGTKSGMIIVLNDEFPIGALREALRRKITESASFLGDASVAISFEGKELTEEEKLEMVSIITENSNLNVVCITDVDDKKEESMRNSLMDSIKEIEKNTGLFYKGTIKSGEKIEYETGLIILGDVEKGACVVSKGSIVVLGSLYGTAIAGTEGRPDIYIAAVNMEPEQLRICGAAGRPPEASRFKKKKMNGPRIAYLEDGFIYVDPIINK